MPKEEQDFAAQIKKTAILKRGPTKDELEWLEKQGDEFAYIYGLHISGENDTALE